MNSKALYGCLCLVLLSIFISGCVPSPVKPADSPFQRAQPFRPPTPDIPTPAPTATATPTQAPVNSTPGVVAQPAECQENLTFIRDVTIPDGTEVEPLATLDKRWEVENSGNCNWSETYRMKLVAGPDLGAQTEQALYPARSGSRAVLRVVFKAPSEAGTYKSAWQAIDPQGEPFGDPFFIEITVK